MLEWVGGSTTGRLLRKMATPTFNFVLLFVCVFVAVVVVVIINGNGKCAAGAR